MSFMVKITDAWPVCPGTIILAPHPREAHPTMIQGFEAPFQAEHGMVKDVNGQNVADCFNDVPVGERVATVLTHSWRLIPALENMIELAEEDLDILRELGKNDDRSAAAAKVAARNIAGARHAMKQAKGEA